MDFSLVVQEKAVPLHSQTRKCKFRLQKTLGYGVMVTLQILVLSFLVRIRVSQQDAKFFRAWRFFLCTYSFRPYSLYTPPIRIHAGSSFSLSIEPIYLGSLHYLREIIFPLIYSCITSLTDHTDSLGSRCALMIPLQGVGRLS